MSQFSAEFKKGLKLIDEFGDEYINTIGIDVERIFKYSTTFRDNVYKIKDFAKKNIDLLNSKQLYYDTKIEELTIEAAKVFVILHNSYTLMQLNDQILMECERKLHEIRIKIEQL